MAQGPLRLVHSDPPAAADGAREQRVAHSFIRERELDLERAIHCLLPTSAHLVPYDSELILALWPHGYDRPKRSALRAGLQAMVSAGRLAVVVVGTIAHLALPRGGEPGVGAKADMPGEELLRPGAAAEDFVPDALNSEAREFELQVQLDVARERVLLFRILVVLGLIGSLLLLREGVMWWLQS